MTKIACLMGTFGRYTLAMEALSCFLQQTAIDEAMLLVHNQHPIPLVFDHPNIRIVNEVAPKQRLRNIRQRMVDMIADEPFEFIHYWDDDDLYLPWHLEDCLANVGDAIAWKPQRSWYTQDNAGFRLEGNRFEASWIMRKEAFRRVDVNNRPEFMEHPFIIETEDAGMLEETDLGDFASYIYRWGMNTQHISGYGQGDPAQQAAFLESWRERSADTRPDGRVIPADLTDRWRAYLDGIRPHVSADSLDEIEVRLAIAGAAVAL